MSTIYALSTVFGKSGVAVFRISGPDALRALELLGLDIKQPRPRFVYFARLFDEQLLIDEVLVVYFASPASFTGEDVVELHSHGSIAVLRYISEKLSTLFKPAEPGEFTRRAVLNNRMDLTKAEGIIDIINSETQEQLKQASRHLSGKLAEEYNSLRDKIIKVLSYLEAYIDFPDEEIPETVLAEIQQSIVAIQCDISRYLADGKVGEKIREGFSVVIVGKPNVGKSTLFNYLAKRDLAIVTDIPGTTRDILEVRLDCHGYPVILSDTAGIQETCDAIEKMGITRALKKATEADVIVFLRDITELHLTNVRREDVANSVIERHLDRQVAALGSREHIQIDQRHVDKLIGSSDWAQEMQLNEAGVRSKNMNYPDIEERDLNLRDILDERHEEKDRSVMCHDMMQEHDPDNGECSDDVDRRFNELFTAAKKLEIPVVKVVTKGDIAPTQLSFWQDKGYICISVYKGEGMQLLLDKIFDIISSSNIEAHIITRARHRLALENALEHLRRFNTDLPIELAAEEIKLAANHIASVTGEIKLDDVLDEIFSSFCIGK
ncbi:tRNA uridine-5-carboxymethylaminomethyl(34) synthesis GTPase MnmE [Neorickettsia sennetsu]|uniref:tRNA modification GTPase MnmE n=1 Tax=Ehrlichia sennetsu (strain ATCC VR-367 / Miyayama) TaxID=222891 RepID=MNME_EHRS3|nr:tRNA uridine-5-carboxymethylaminomethyl(34) synthesis GTPase MnmE [Neorickettsia sennetsu]Q2GD53.1 RecName: Full=tRNA modification GTPase MnmE [Neorickettsia sennetsu str. Miyayama]ABD46378.1 tRNA modification GTPase TrmE [Neorickettsia sennetsu str. Miyayama]